MQGEDQKKLDILANQVFLNMLAKSGQCAVVVSVCVPNHHYSCHVTIMQLISSNIRRHWHYLQLFAIACNLG